MTGENQVKLIQGRKNKSDQKSNNNPFFQFGKCKKEPDNWKDRKKNKKPAF